MTSRKRPAVTVALVLGLISACSGEPMTSPTASNHPTGSAAASSEATATPQPTPPPRTALNINWMGGIPFDGTVSAVTGDRGAFVAVSGDWERRLAWSSIDGQSWSAVEVPDPAPSDCEDGFLDSRCFPNSAGMGQLVRLGDTLYSLGNSTSINDYLRPVGWRLTDGQTWQPIHSDSEFFHYGWVIDVAASDTAIVAARTTPYYSSDIWRWASDTSWVASGLATDRDPSALPLDVHDIAWRDGTFLAVGGTADFMGRQGVPATDPDAWSSSNGKRWEPVATPEGAVSLCSATATSAGFVVLGSTDAGLAAWTATVPGEWTRTDLAEEVIAPPDRSAYPLVCSVVELDSGLLAVYGVESGTITWTSVDGQSWKPGGSIEIATRPDEVAAVGDTVVLFGRPTSDQGMGVVPSTLFLGTVAP